VREARAVGLLPFAVTIDDEAAEVMPQLFGRHAYARVRRPQDLAARLPQVYAQLTRQAQGA
jgi:nitric oxide reductase NorD protein